MRKNIFHRMLLAVLFALGTASCGFTPVYGTGSTTGASLSDIVVAAPRNDRADYFFVRELESRIGRNLNGSKLLEYDIGIYEQGIESLSDRVQMIGNVSYRIISIEDNRLLFSGSEQNFVSYSTDGILVTSISQNSRERLMSILADQVTTKLIAYFSSLSGDKP